MNLRCAIVDDEPLALGLLESYIKKTPFLELSGSYSSAIQAMKYLPDHPVDVLFLDIQMPELNGLEFSRMVSEDTRIIFTTAFDQYALDGYRVNALDYLLKPISYSDFMEAINKAVKWFELQQKADKQSTEGDSDENKKDYIYVKSDYKLIQIELNKIFIIRKTKRCGFPKRKVSKIRKFQKRNVFYLFKHTKGRENQNNPFPCLLFYTFNSNRTSSLPPIRLIVLSMLFS